MTEPPSSLPYKTRFALTHGGPADRALSRMGLITPLVKRIVLFFGVGWLPLLILSAFEGVAIGNAVKIPFLFDIGEQIRLLLVVPLLLAAEPLIGPTLREAVEQFPRENLISADEFPVFQSAIHQAMRLKESVLAEILLIGLVIVADIAHLDAIHMAFASTWLYSPSATGPIRSLAGWWLAFVSLSAYRFLLFRWFWRFFIWARFLWQVSRLRLQLIPTHPDRAGGLAFLGDAQLRFTVIIFCGSAVIASTLANLILYGGQSPFEFKTPIFVYIFLVICLVLFPLFTFTPKLIALKEKGQLEYGSLSMSYSRLFDQTWIQDIAQKTTLLGSEDIQSLAAMDVSFRMVKGMNIVPFDFETIKVLVLAALLPFLPLLLSIIPVQEAWDKLRMFLL